MDGGAIEEVCSFGEGCEKEGGCGAGAPEAAVAVALVSEEAVGREGEVDIVSSLGKSISLLLLLLLLTTKRGA